MQRTYEFRIFPTRRQIGVLEDLLRHHCTLYNAALEARINSYRFNDSNTSFVDQCAELTWIRENVPGVADHARSAQARTLKRLDLAYQAFFRRVKNGETPGFPRFKSSKRWDSVVFTFGDGAGIKDNRVRVAGCHIKLKKHRNWQGVPKTLTVKRRAGRWYVLIACDKIEPNILAPSSSVLGIDMGLTHFLTTSEGEFVENPRWFRKSQEVLAEAQRKLAKNKQSKSARRDVTKTHEKIRNQRKDFQHKLARKMINEHGLIAHEALKIGNMSRSASGTIEEPGTNVAQKSGLNKSILDASWGQFFGLLHSKAEDAGRVVVAVDPKYTSQRHHVCGQIGVRDKKDMEKFFCPACQVHEHADINGALNVLGRGLDLVKTEAHTFRCG